MNARPSAAGKLETSPTFPLHSPAAGGHQKTARRVAGIFCFAGGRPACLRAVLKGGFHGQAIGRAHPVLHLLGIWCPAREIDVISFVDKQATNVSTIV